MTIASSLVLFVVLLYVHELMQQNKSRTVGAGHRDNANRLLAERYYVTFRLWHRPSCRLWRLCTLLGGLNFSVIFCTVRWWKILSMLWWSDWKCKT